MALFNHKPDFELDPFTDLIFNALLIFTFLFLMALLLMNPPAKSGVIDAKAEFIVTVSWPDNDPNDIDVWAAGPGGRQVWYMRPQDGLMHIDRDDRGMANDTQTVDGRVITNPLNQEVLTIRGRIPGEYTINLNYYKSENNQPVPVNVYVAEVNPKLNVLHYSTVTLQKQGDEATAVRFSILPDGSVTGINQIQTSLVKALFK
ncbi:hypothetical protein NQT62_09365 [Limnobacter humi]|uniref:Biopolymer transporter ExbD n=1 Tax=Limnobacter humi TaxID=1778671 RepID=A0ABT1WGX8_9BURK|nr:hypothetical protein [Limnobacter humi]MCQ8896639.1 hypothetical protein [Limnobacter humi]